MNKQRFKIDWASTMEKIKEQTTKKSSEFKDERIYTPEFDTNGVAKVIIRFLPSKDTDLPYVGVYNHSVKGPGGWYIETCPTTIKKECPVCKSNSSLWDSNPDLVRQRKRRLSYYSNILVVKDPINPENDGKVFLYKYGKKIFDKIMEKINPNGSVDDNGNVIPSIEEPVMVFDYYEGANFKLIIKKQKIDGAVMPTYDSSNFDNPSCVGTDDQIEKIVNSLYGLSDFINPDNFKSYDELESKYNRCLGNAIIDEEPQVAKPKAKPLSSPKVTKVVEEEVFNGNDDDFFKDIISEDDEE